MLIERAIPRGIEVAATSATRHDRLPVGGGGDWYDAFALADGRCAIAIGDLSGCGPEAAALRHAVRALALAEPELEAVARRADAWLRSYAPDRFSTAFFGLYDPAARELRSVRCGHPRPLLRTSDGTVSALPGEVSPPLGLLDLVPALAVARQPIPPGAVLFCYTDGLIGPRVDPEVGLRRLCDALTLDRLAGSPHDLARWILHGEPPQDDAVAMSIRFR